MSRDPMKSLTSDVRKRDNTDLHIENLSDESVEFLVLSEPIETMKPFWLLCLRSWLRMRRWIIKRIRARNINRIKLIRLMCGSIDAIRKSKPDLSTEDVYETAYLFAISYIKLMRLKSVKSRLLLQIRHLKRIGQISEHEAFRYSNKISDAYEEQKVNALF